MIGRRENTSSSQSKTRQRMDLHHILHPSSAQLASVLPQHHNSSSWSPNRQGRQHSRKQQSDAATRTGSVPHTSFQHYNNNDESHSAPIISPSHHGAQQLAPRLSVSRPRDRSESDSSSIITARRDFAVAITRPSPRRGYLECRLCDKEVWGPNGRYHIDKCPVLSAARETARSHGARLTSVGGIHVHPDVFKSTRRPKPKPAKVPGFVMSHSVSMENPRQALTEEELDAGKKRGRKGYVRCLRCNCEVFAPNARYHASHCETDTQL